MLQPESYQTTYTDKNGTKEIIIFNDYKTLSFELNGVQFEGDSFAEFEVKDREYYTTEQLEPFSFSQISVHDSDKFRMQLTNCMFQVIIPQTMYDLKQQFLFTAHLCLEYLLGKELVPGINLDGEWIKLSVTIEGVQYDGAGETIEYAFDSLYKQFGDHYKFRNCYGCLYGDYGVAGNGAFGYMLCYVAQKEHYVQVQTKREYMDLTKDFTAVQEIYSCNQYEIRKKGTGYRG